MWCCCGPRQLSTRASGTWEARWRTILWSGSMRSGCKGKGRGRLTRGWGAGLTGGGGVDTAVNGLKNRTGYIWKNVLTTWHFLPGILPRCTRSRSRYKTWRQSIREIWYTKKPKKARSQRQKWIEQQRGACTKTFGIQPKEEEIDLNELVNYINTPITRTTWDFELLQQTNQKNRVDIYHQV